jgi:hypothetical protein
VARQRVTAVEAAVTDGATVRPLGFGGRETWPNTLTENLYLSLKVGPQFGPTLCNFR